MATLNEYLTNIANAIREKKGTTDKINAQNFASEIASIEGGGGSYDPTQIGSLGICTNITDDNNLFTYAFAVTISAASNFPVPILKTYATNPSWSNVATPIEYNGKKICGYATNMFAFTMISSYQDKNTNITFNGKLKVVSINKTSGALMEEEYTYSTTVVANYYMRLNIPYNDDRLVLSLKWEQNT